MSFPKKLFKFDRVLFFLIAAVALLTMIFGCKKENDARLAFAKADPNPTKQVQPREVPQEFKDYWYAGTAEISSYKLEQARYGEIRQGTAALIFVTEDFLPEEQVKADRQDKENVPVLKLNATKNFNTGIYPYSLMTSTFTPVFNEKHAIKISQSMQEWCGHIYSQINNREQFEITSHSYFEGEADTSFSLKKDILENDLWNLLRIDPDALPTGNIKVIPSLEYIRMKHVPLKAYNVIATNKEGVYTLEFPKLDRKLVINYSPDFPYIIESWEETFKSGFGPKAQSLTTKATRIKTIKSAYWGKNSNADAGLREELGL